MYQLIGRWLDQDKTRGIRIYSLVDSVLPTDPDRQLFHEIVSRFKLTVTHAKLTASPCEPGKPIGPRSPWKP